MLKGHVKAAHFPSPYMCSACSRSFDKKEKLDFHVEVQHLLKNIEMCPYCQKPYRKLKVHMEKCNVDPDKREKFFCECGLSYTDKGGLRHHRKTKCPLRKKEKFECSNCGKKFINRTSIDKHVQKFCKFASVLHCFENQL